MNKASKWLWNLKKSEQEFEVWCRQRGGLGRCNSLLVYDTFETHMTENVKVVFAKELQFSSNSSQIDLSSLTHSVPWVIEELDSVGSGWYPWLYSGWLPKGSIRTTDRFVAGASSDISEEMTKSSFLKCFQIRMSLPFFFVTTSSVFYFLFFFVKVQSKIGVHIIHGRTLYTGKYGMLIFFL